MSEKVTEFCRRTVFWWPAIIRAILYSQVVMISAFLIQSEKLASPDTLIWGWMEWCRFWFPVWSAGLVNLVAFLDQTMGVLRKKDGNTWKPGESV